MFLKRAIDGKNDFVVDSTAHQYCEKIAKKLFWRRPATEIITPLGGNRIQGRIHYRKADFICHWFRDSSFSSCG